MSVKETHLTGTPASVTKYVSEEKEAHRGRGGEEYTTGYYSENNQVPSLWMGKGAELQGLSGAVSNPDLEKLLAGVTMSGEDISKRGNHGTERRMGSDWTFSAPKAASILAIEDPRIKEWMLEAVQEAIEEFYAQEMAYARKGKGGAVTEFSENVAVAGFLHETARAADGTIDPQIHVHCVTPNMVQREDGTWVSLRADYGENNKKVYTLGDVQTAKLMKKMQEKGGYDLETRLERDANGIEHLSFGVKGISREAEDVFSGRKKQIDAYLEANGIDPKKATRAQKDAAALATRAGKDKNVDAVDLKYQQRERAREAGVDLGQMRAAADRRAADRGKGGAEQITITGRDAVKSAIHHLSERESVFSRADLIRESVLVGAGKVDLQDIHKAIKERAGGLVRVGDRDRDGTGKFEEQFTTKAAIFREAEILHRAKAGQGQAEAIIPTSTSDTGQEIQEVIPDVSFTAEELTDGKRSYGSADAASTFGGSQKTEPLSQHGLRNLSECGLDANQKREDSGVLPDHAGVDRSGNPDLRRATDDPRVSKVIAEREARQSFAFSQGQRNAVALALTSEDRHIGIVGAAGAGKTTAMAAIVEQYRKAGYEIVGVAPSAAAAKELESAGCDDTRTLASALLMKQEQKDGEKPPKRLYIMDESGMVSARDMDAFLIKADGEGARSILVGDPLQLQSVEAGSAFKQLLETGSIDHVRIDEIQRQKDPQLREIAQAFARGDAQQGVELARPYMQQVQVEKGEDKVDKLAGVAARAYLDLLPEERQRTLLLAGTNGTRQAINQKIRDGLKTEGTLTGQTVQITAMDKMDLTREAATRAENYTSRDGGGQVIVKINQQIKDKDGNVEAARGSQWRVADNRDGKLTLESLDGQKREIIIDPAKAKLSAYESRKMELQAGDQVMFRENDKERGIVNGTQAKIIKADEITGDIIAQTKAGERIVLNPSRAETLDYSYARTVHSSQGATVERAIIVGEASRVATAEAAYVACSREKTGLTIITDSTDKLGKNWGKFAERQSALDSSKTQAPESYAEIQQARESADRDLGKSGDFAKKRAAANEAANTAGPDLGDIARIPDPLDPDLGSEKFQKKMDAAMENIAEKQANAGNAESAALNTPAPATPSGNTEKDNEAPQPAPEPELEIELGG